MPPPSHASLFFEHISNLGPDAFSYLEALAKKTAQTDENEWREFKSAGFISAPPKKDKFDPDRKLKEIWSECLGAFANSGGGVLIWGIKAPNKIAEGTDLAANAKTLGERLMELANEAVDPPILGVEMQAVTKRSSLKGFVVCYVPASDFLPHRSIWADREYYIRTQDGNRPISTAILRRMFYPRISPLVVPVAKAGVFRGNDGSYQLNMTVDLRNRGMASAEDIAIQFVPLRQQCQTYSDNQRWSRELMGGGGFYFRGVTTIHPDETIRWLTNCTSDIRNWIETGRMLDFTFRIFARNAAALNFTLSFSAAELSAPAQRDRHLEREATLVSS